jgi:hypothetical protein
MPFISIALFALAAAASAQTRPPRRFRTWKSEVRRHN